MKPLPRRLRLLLPVITGLVLLGLWYAIHHLLPADQRFLLPLPGRIFAAFSDKSTELLAAAKWTSLAALGGFTLAIVVSAISSLLLAASPLIRAALYPWLMALQLTPIIIVAPILILWLSPGLPAVIVVTFLISFFPMVVNNTQGLLSADQNHVDLFRMGRATRWQQFRHLRIPAAAPYFFSGLRIAAVLAPIGALTGDYQVGTLAGGESGLGIQALLFSARSEIPALYATAIIACLLGWLFVAVVSYLAWLVLHRWHDSYAP